jgi:hypothetical protein
VRSPRCVEPVLPVSVRTPLATYSLQARKSTTQHVLSRPLRLPNDFTTSHCLPSAANSRQISALPVDQTPACGIAAKQTPRLDQERFQVYDRDGLTGACERIAGDLLLGLSLPAGECTSVRGSRTLRQSPAGVL